MTSSKSRLPLANFAIALAAGLAMVSYGVSLVDLSAAAETLYFAVWATAVLVAIAGLASDFEVGIAAVLSTLIVWAVPTGPTRGAALGLVLVLALFLTLARRLALESESLTWQTAVAGAIGLQALCRADRFLQIGLDPRTLISLVVLPVIVAIALIFLQRNHPARSVVLAAMVVALLVPGFSVTATLAIVALALGTLWRDHFEPGWLVLTLSIITIVAAFFWQPSLAGLIAGTLIALRAPRSFRTYLGLIGFGTVLCLLYPAVRSWSEVLSLASVGLLLLPALLVPSGRRRSYAVCGAILGILALRTVAGPDALAAPLALAALSLRFRGSAARVQSVWTAALLFGSTLLATYPWLRHHALEDALGLVGVEVGWFAAVAVVAITWILTLICAPFEALRTERGMAPWIAGGSVVALATWIALPAASELPLENRIRVLNGLTSELTVELSNTPSVRSVVLDSYLENSAALPTGTEVATVVLIDSSGQSHRWTLRAGTESGEWAARRPDVAALEGFAAPDPWISWVTPRGDLFAQRYRATWVLETQVEAKRLSIQRSPTLADEISMAIFHLELRQ
jgi:hypothetical protein